nr:glycoside hydrolase family 99-like domain-containing protein [uncultured Schaedlerella sp.]
MKILALYLPQFHRVPENDEWWGEGFTEWTTVRNALPLFPEHEQPHIPKDNYYYDLLDKSTFQKQAEQIKNSGMDGICIYHYWFKNGRQILEKPAEKLLQWKDIQLPYCFSWAHEPWARTWGNFGDQNKWTSIYDKGKNSDRELLLEQKYGNAVDWKRHFEYLLPFFSDNRYIKIDGKPVFEFHRAREIPCLENMIWYWKELAKDYGLKGLYFIGNEVKKSQESLFDEVMIHEPQDAMLVSKTSFKDVIRCFDYDEVWRNILKRGKDKNISLTGYAGYDDTPRHGTQGTAITNGSPEKFEKYMTKLIQINKQNHCRVMFVNAWNEWGEGMYLEPDEKYGDSYLCAMKRAVDQSDANLQNEDLFHKMDSAVPFDCYDAMQFRYDRERHIGRVLDKWLSINENKKNWTIAFKNKKLAIYGYGLLGKHLITELEQNNMIPEFIIDRNQDIKSQYPIYGVDDNWPDVQTIIVSAIYDYGNVFHLIKEKQPDVEVVSLEHIIMEM